MFGNKAASKKMFFKNFAAAQTAVVLLAIASFSTIVNAENYNWGNVASMAAAS